MVTFAPERGAQPQVGWQRGGEHAHAQAASAVDLDVAPDQQRVGTPVGEHQPTIPTAKRHIDRRALRLLEGGGAQADLAGDRAAERQGGQSKTSASPQVEVTSGQQLQMVCGHGADGLAPTAALAATQQQATAAVRTDTASQRSGPTGAGPGRATLGPAQVTFGWQHGRACPMPASAVWRW